MKGNDNILQPCHTLSTKENLLPRRGVINGTDATEGYFTLYCEVCSVGEGGRRGRGWKKDGESGGEKKGKEEGGENSREGEGTEKGGRRKSLREG